MPLIVRNTENARASLGVAKKPDRGFNEDISASKPFLKQ
jgi:hypothetical protein